VAWGADGPLESVDFYFGTRRTGTEIASLVWDTLVWRDPEDFSYKPLLARHGARSMTRHWSSTCATTSRSRMDRGSPRMMSWPR
jgi:hypothetical protein